MEPLTLRAALKAHTGPAHERLEAQLDLTGPGMDLAGYAATLERFLGYYAPLETLLASAAWPEHGVVYSERLKTPALARDLGALGRPASALDALPRCGALPRLDSPARRVGCLYVVEGSTLGGQFLARHFGRAMGLTPATGCAFFSGYGPETGPRWAAFVQLLEALDAPETREETLDAALETFETLEAWMAGVRREAGTGVAT